MTTPVKIGKVVGAAAMLLASTSHSGRLTRLREFR
jgi:hypothetical protein